MIKNLTDWDVRVIIRCLEESIDHLENGIDRSPHQKEWLNRLIDERRHILIYLEDKAED